MTAARKPKPYKYIPLPPDFCPAICTFDEACSYARHSRWTGHQKVKEGRWRTFRTAASVRSSSHPCSKTWSAQWP